MILLHIIGLVALDLLSVAKTFKHTWSLIHFIIILKYFNNSLVLHQVLYLRQFIPVAHKCVHSVHPVSHRLVAGCDKVYSTLGLRTTGVILTLKGQGEAPWVEGAVHALLPVKV